MTLYHGSTGIIEKPDLRFSAKTLDFGAGFYTTANEEQARAFARIVKKRLERNGRQNVKSFISVYHADYTALQKEFEFLSFASADTEWLDFVVANRMGAYNGRKYDIIQGPVANDTIFRTITLYMSGLYTKEHTIEQLKVRKLYNQITFATEAVISRLRFVGYKEV
jgi:hypothetical protein